MRGSVAGMSRGAVATAILKAIMGGGEYPPDGVPDTPHNRQVWGSMKREVANLPPGATIDLPSDWADA
jgi:hypothetical protein